MEMEEKICPKCKGKMKRSSCAYLPLALFTADTEARVVDPDWKKCLDLDTFLALGR